jgi:HD-like signal output (HDOD) protein
MSRVEPTQPASAAPGAPAALADVVAALIAAGKVPVPLLPQVASRVLEVAGDARSDAAQLSALIHRDPSLAAQILKVANSPAYQPRMPIVSLQQAVARLGVQALTEIALAASLGSGVFKVPGFERELRQMWRFAVAASAFAKEVARARRLNVESAFLCGLLHDMGRPVVLQLAVAESTRAGLGATTPDSRAEVLAIAEAQGPAVSGLVAAAWKLPEAVRAAIVHHGAPEGGGAHAREAAITAAARHLALGLLAPERLGGRAPDDHPAFALLNLYRDDVRALLDKADAVRAAVDALCS